jgi:hypothetical protein
VNRHAGRVGRPAAGLFLAALVSAVSLWGTAAPAATVASAKGPHPTTTTTHTTTTVETTTAPTTTIPTTTTVTKVAPPSTAPRSHPSRHTTSTTEPPAPPTPLAAPGVSLVGQAAWISTQGSDLLDLQLDQPSVAAQPNAAVELTFYDSVSTRTDFADAVNGTPQTNVVARLSFALSSVQLNRQHRFVVAFGIVGSAQPRSVDIDRPGVYPVGVGLVGTNVTHGTFVTWMVVIDRQQAKSSQPLRVSWIWQVQAGPSALPTGGVDPSTLAAMRPGGRLDRIASLLGRAGSFPLTLGIGPEMLESWQRQARTVPALRRGFGLVRQAAARGSTQLLPEPYVPISGPAIEAEGLGSHLPEEYLAGSSAIADATGELPDPRTAFVDPVDTPTLDQLTQTLIGRFVVRDSSLAKTFERLTPAQPFNVTTSDGVAAPAAASDGGLEALFDSPGPPALREQRVVAALAEIAYEAPSQARGVIIATPTDWTPDVATVSALLGDLAADPLVEPATLDTLFTQVAPEQRNGAVLQRHVAPIPSNLPLPLPLPASEYNAAVRQLAAYGSMVGPTDPSIATGQHALLLALSTANSPARVQAYLAGIAAKLQTLTSGITTTAKTLTLTARRAYLPLSFQNNTGRAGIHVLVHLDSTKLIFPKGPDFPLTLPLGHSTAKQNEFPVEARASGTFVMTITLESPDRSVKLGTTSVTIRSTVFSGIGIALTLGALLFLAGWWGNHFVRTRRARRHARMT